MNAMMALFVALAAQDKIDLKFRPSQGDALTVETRGTMEMSVTGGGQTFKVSFINKKKVHTEFAEVVDGAVVRRVVHTETDVDERKGPIAERQENPLHGRTVTVVVKEGKTVLEGAEDLDEESKRRVSSPEWFLRFLPKKPVAIGESWELSAKELKDALESQQEMQGKAVVTLREVKEIDGRRCAVIAMKWDLKGKPGGETETSLTLEGEAAFWVERGYMMYLKGKGAMKMKRGEEGSGEGPVTMEITATLK